MVLDHEEVQACMAAFEGVAQGRERIDVWDLGKLLQELDAGVPGQKDLFQLISEVDTNVSGAVDVHQFLRIVERQKQLAAAGDEDDLLETFIACGGRKNRFGYVTKEYLVQTVRDDIGLLFDISQHFDAVDTARTGRLDWNGFKQLLA